MPLIDSHAHVFLRSLPMAPDRRYTPGYDATLARYLAMLDENGIAGGVLVQPSFLGTDNSFLLDCLATEPERLRGVAVLDPAVGDAELLAMDKAGIVGIRFNLIGRAVDELATASARTLMRRIGELGWHVEVQAKGPDLPVVFRHLAGFAGNVVIDHFGLPDPALGLRDPGFRALLGEGEAGRTYVKLSAGYRCGGLDVAPLAGALIAMLGPERLVWGSDWPWTQFESGRSYSAIAAQIAGWLPDREALAAIDLTATTLFGFSPDLSRRILPNRKVA